MANGRVYYVMVPEARNGSFMTICCEIPETRLFEWLNSSSLKHVGDQKTSRSNG